MFARVKHSGKYEYLQIVENFREAHSHKQRVLTTVGRLDVLQASGQLDGLTRSLARFCENLSVLDAYREGAVECRGVRRTGPALVFGRLWRELGIGPVIEALLAGRKFGFSVERAVFVTVLHRLFGAGSDRQGQRWLEDYAVEGAASLDLHQMYRAMAWLGEVLPEPKTALGKTCAPRCMKDTIEERLFAKRRDLFTELEMVFFDTTSLYFEGAGGETVGQYGKSKDHRPDLKQMVVGAVLEDTGRPLCCELWPGNAADAKALRPVVDRLRTRFGIERMCVVADRGMISRTTRQALEAMPGVDYILGVRMRAVKEVRERVLADRRPFEVVHPKSPYAKAPSPLQVKEVVIEGRRYIVCYNEDQARKDAADRTAILAHLEEELTGGDVGLVGNRGYRKYLSQAGAGFYIDEAKVGQAARYDGHWVLQTTTGLPPRDAALKYKQLWMVEDVFRTTKSVLDTRPIWHKCDETIRGHGFCSFLALLLKTELFERLDARGNRLEWADIRRDLDALQETQFSLDGTTYYLRTPLRGACHDILQAVGVAPPKTLHQ
jgi:hypothetical protein